MINKLRATTLIIIGILSLCAINSVSAKQFLDISPLSFDLTINPGEVSINQLEVRNNENYTIGVRINTEDIEAVGEKGQVIVEPPGTKTHSIADWIDFDLKEFVLEPQESKLVNFEISVPEDAKPEGRYGTIIASAIGMAASESGMIIVPRVGALVLLRVGGEAKEEVIVKSFSCSDYSQGQGITFTMRLENKGVVHAKPEGSIIITDQQGKEVANLDLSDKYIMPDAAREIKVYLEEGELQTGGYAVNVVGHYGKENIPLDSPEINFIVPSGKGLEVFSFTHSKQDEWYTNNDPAFFWNKEEGVTGFSYSFDQDPVSIPDNIPEIDQTSISYNKIDDGAWYFHIKAKKWGSWGETIHYPVKIDVIPFYLEKTFITENGIQYKDNVISWWMLILVLMVILSPLGFVMLKKRGNSKKF